MKRSVFVATVGSLSLGGAFSASARGVPTIVAVSCSIDELEAEAEDSLAGLLRDRGVNVVDPSAIDARYHDRARLVVKDLGDAVAFDYSHVSWVTAKYHARRLMAVQVRFTTSSLPYGAFTVYNVRARASYRDFDTVDKSVVASGTALGVGRGEDERAAQEAGLADAMAAVAHDFSRRGDS